MAALGLVWFGADKTKDGRCSASSLWSKTSSPWVVGSVVSEELSNLPNQSHRVDRQYIVLLLLRYRADKTSTTTDEVANNEI